MRTLKIIQVRATASVRGQTRTGKIKFLYSKEPHCLRLSTTACNSRLTQILLIFFIVLRNCSFIITNLIYHDWINSDYKRLFKWSFFYIIIISLYQYYIPLSGKFVVLIQFCQVDLPVFEFSPNCLEATYNDIVMLYSTKFI